MNMMNPTSYPGDAASPKQIYDLAVQYHCAADTIAGNKKAQWPARLLALQAIEGYLIAHTRNAGLTNEEVRTANHNLVSLADVGAETGLALRNRTHLHLNKICQSREYLVTRYGPEAQGRLSQQNELQSTLKELQTKVARTIGLKP